jgi:hypothetical protein
MPDRYRGSVLPARAEATAMVQSMRGEVAGFKNTVQGIISY